MVNKGTDKPPYIEYEPHMHCEYCGRFVNFNKLLKIAKCHYCQAAWIVCFRGEAAYLRKTWYGRKEASLILDEYRSTT